MKAWLAAACCLMVSAAGCGGGSVPLPKTKTAGGVVVEIQRAEIGRPVLVSGDQSKPMEMDMLLVYVRVFNAGSAKPIEYHTWGGPWGALKDKLPSAVDDRGRKCDPNPSIGWTWKDGIDDKVLKKGESVDDVVIFTPPAADAKSLQITLPGLYIGENANAVLTLPGSMIRGLSR